MSKTVKNFNSREHMKNQMLDYLCIALGLMFYTIGWTCFLLPYKIVTGALTGLSAIVFYVTGIPIYQTYLTLNVVMLIAALKILGLRFLLKTIYAIVLLSTMLTLAQSWMTGADGQMIQILGAGNTFMALIIGTMFTGSGLAIVFLSNGSTGGTDIIAACINKYKDISLGNVLICVNFCIIGSCLFFSAFGATMQERLHTVVFGLFTLLTENVMLDYVFNSRRQSVQFLIFSKNYEKIASAIGSTTHHGVTILVHQHADQGALRPGPQAREPIHLPPHQVCGPPRLRLTVGRHWRLWQWLRRDQGQYLGEDAQGNGTGRGNRESSPKEPYRSP